MQFTICSGSAIDEAIAKISDADEIAIDTEFHAENRHTPELLLLSIHIPNVDTVLIDPQEPGAMSRIAEVVSTTPWIVHAGSRDIALLNAAFGNVPTEIFDTQIAAGLLSPAYPASFQSIVSDYGEHVPSKGETLSDWKRRPLSNAQLNYSAGDVIPLPHVAHVMRQALAKRNRLGIAKEAFQEAITLATTTSNPDLAYLHIPSLPSLSRQGAAILQALAAWREEQALRENRSPFSVISNAALHRFSREQPTSIQDLQKNRRLSKRVIGKYGEALLEKIQVAASRPEWAWPHHIQNDTAAQDRAFWLDVVARAVGREEDFSAKLLLPPHLRDAIAINPEKAIGCMEEVLSWRNALIGLPIISALRGESTLWHPNDANGYPTIRK
jgi:ribonuclease D